MADNLPTWGDHHWGVIGIGRDQWMLVAAALTLGGSIRVGLEDNFYLPDGDDGPLERGPDREGAADDRGRRSPPGDRRGGAALLGIKRSGGSCRVSGSARRPAVLDLTRLLPGGFCSMLLADFGADVIKVEDTGLGDYVRWAPPHYEGAEPSAGSALFLSLNRGKRSIRIDLKAPAGKDVLLALVRDADVLLESFVRG